MPYRRSNLSFVNLIIVIGLLIIALSIIVFAYYKSISDSFETVLVSIVSGFLGYLSKEAVSTIQAHDISQNIGDKNGSKEKK